MVDFIMFRFSSVEFHSALSKVQKYIWFMIYHVGVYYIDIWLPDSIISSWNMQLILTNIQEFNGR